MCRQAILFAMCYKLIDVIERAMLPNFKHRKTLFKLYFYFMFGISVNDTCDLNGVVCDYGYLSSLPVAHVTS